MEMNGWAILRDAYMWDDDTYDEFPKVVRDIESRLSKGYTNEVLTLRYMNGAPTLNVALNHNHYNGDGDWIVDLFRYIGQVASGSYGLLHVRDYEGRYGDDNTMYVWVLARGEVVRYKDPFLTPCYPNVEGYEVGLEPPAVAARISKYLPLGSVVVLKSGEKKLMIIGRCQQDSANDKVFDYSGVPYPEGNIAPKATFLFNHDDIVWVHYLGFADSEEDAWVDKLKELPSSQAVSGESA